MLLFSWLAALSALLQHPVAPPATPVHISKSQFLGGKKPAALTLPGQGYRVNKAGLRIGQCPLLNNITAVTEQLAYTPLGVSQAAPALFFSKATDYNGYFVVATNSKTCRSVILSGYPLLNGRQLVCFNDQETTDVQDVISVWSLTADGKLTLRHKIPPPKNHIHYSPDEVRFSPDGRQLYYLNTAQQYVAVRLDS